MGLGPPLLGESLIHPYKYNLKVRTQQSSRICTACLPTVSCGILTPLLRSHVQEGYPLDIPTPPLDIPTHPLDRSTPWKGPGTRDTHPQKGHGTRDIPPVKRSTDTRENITFSQIRLRVEKNFK